MEGKKGFWSSRQFAWASGQECQHHSIVCLGGRHAIHRSLQEPFVTNMQPGKINIYLINDANINEHVLTKCVSDGCVRGKLIENDVLCRMEVDLTRIFVIFIVRK